MIMKRKNNNNNNNNTARVKRKLIPSLTLKPVRRIQMSNIFDL